MSYKYFQNKIRYCVNAALIVFLILLIDFNENSLSGQQIIQYFFVLLTLLFFNINFNNRIRITTVLFNILLFQIICVLLIYFYGLVDYPPDGVSYRRFATLYPYRNFDFIVEDSLGFDDWGIKLIVGPLFEYFGCKYGEIGVHILNFIAHICTCFIIFLISSDLYGKSIANNVTLLWGLNLGAVYWNTAFLKEGFFCFFVTGAIYGLYKSCNSKNMLNNKYFLMFILFTVICTFFRKIVPLFLLSSLGIKVLLKYLPAKYFKYIIVGILLMTYFALDFIISYFPEAAGGFSQRDETYGSGIMSFLNIINPFISPYPAISIYNNQTVNIQMAVFASYNIVLAYFVIMGFYHCLREKVILLYPLLMCLALNSIMLIAYGFSMNYRYIYITSPIAYLLIPFGMKYINKKWLFIPYLCIVFIITLLYNTR